MHELVVFVDLLSVSLRGKPSQSLFEDVNSQRLVGSDEHIDTEVKLVAVD